jgi:hypothetical protein
VAGPHPATMTIPFVFHNDGHSEAETSVTNEDLLSMYSNLSSDRNFDGELVVTSNYLTVNLGSWMSEWKQWSEYH